MAVMFYLSLTIFIVMIIVYLPLRGWIELQKWKIRKNVQDEQEWKYEKE